MRQESPRPTLLIISLSHIVGDARVLKQVRLFSQTYRVVTCGYGPKPEHVDEHHELFRSEPKYRVLWRALLIRAQFFRAAYWSSTTVRNARSRLRRVRADVVLANDLDTAPLALETAPAAQVHLDLHEYWPGLHDNSAAWRRLRQPYFRWMLRNFATRANSVTTVSDVIAERYQAEFGFISKVVANASEFQHMNPTATDSPIRLVHSGGTQPSRRIENMMQAVARTTSATMDLYLVGEGTDYYRSLVTLAGELGPRIRILPPVTPQELPGVLNQYDIGVHVLPPTNTNNELALPNKFFDYVQARLALVIGPTASMQSLLEQHGLGVVTRDFSIDALTEALDMLTVERVQQYKSNVHASAAELSAAPQNAVWQQAIEAIAPVKGDSV